MYKSKYYECSPNVEVVSNQSFSFFFPPFLSVSNRLLQTYDYDESRIEKDKTDHINIYDYFTSIDKDKDGNQVDIHELLDLTMLTDENIINLQLLFSEVPNKDNYNIVQQLRTRGIFLDPNVLLEEKEVN